MKHSTGEKVFLAVNYAIIALLALLALLPFLNIISKSVSSEAAVTAGRVGFWPIGFQLSTYRFALNQPLFTGSLWVSVIVTVGGTLLSMLFTCIAAYPLSRSHFRGRKQFVLIFVFTMIFNGGLIPNFLLVKGLGLTNTLWSLILPGLINVFNLLVVKSFFETVPDSLEESAKIDGATNLWVFVAIVLPISLPVIATVSLYYAVGYWNNFFSAMMYISKQTLKPLQLYLYELVMQSQNMFLLEGDLTQYGDITPSSVRAASTVLGTVPILLVYPFLQKYFIKGMTLGAVKE